MIRGSACMMAYEKTSCSVNTTAIARIGLDAEADRAVRFRRASLKDKYLHEICMTGQQ